MKIIHRKDAINYYKDAINRRLYKGLIVVETAIHRVSCLNRIVLGMVEQKSISIIYRVGINGTRE
ncbi:MAG: hypothetical protein RMZ41_020870 [Nostoc sp. DedVER02]|uniref:hypothetical protein n=1 Tax=Nostoc sp. DedVER02 TaxID=3075405 RepID=UPI002AD2D92E|nr:hypothetical protein [Nostoc sp. DedVER02]MDZ7984825.1 hypothetical protein [Nostoc sp. DedVER02]